MYNIGSVVEVLAKCKRKMLNLKFDQRTFGPSSNILWRRCGRRIQSLLFVLCSFSPEIVKRILINCKNLNEFSCCGGGVDGFYATEEDLPRRKSILQINDDVVRSKLKTLRLDSESLALRECDLRLISSAFPQLESLRIRLCLSEDLEIIDSPNFIVLLNLLDSGFKNLEKLHVDFSACYQVELTDFTCVSQFNLDRLKDVSMSLTPFILRDDSLTKILSYKFWRSFRISWFYPYEPDLAVVTRLLDENPLLEKLDLHIHVTLSIIPDFSDLFKALVKSRLKSLTMSTHDYAWSLEIVQTFVAAVAATLEGLQCNDTVEYLSVHSERSAEFSSLFVKYFRNIRDLEAYPGNVNTIFKYQTNLKSLRIEPLGAIRTDEPPARRSVESLELMYTRPLALDMFTTYQFPNLKYLFMGEANYFYDTIRLYEDDGEDLIGPPDLNVNEEDGGNAINQNDFEGEHLTDPIIFIRKMNTLMLSIFRRSPHLEAIHFDCDYRLDVEALRVFFQSCLHFHQLRYVLFSCNSPPIDEPELKFEVSKYFRKCPSFRALWLKTSTFNLAFYFNTVTKKYEFSHEFSSVDYPATYCVANLHDFWRYKR